MPEYSYSSLATDGSVQRGRIEASDERDAFRRLSDRGLSPFDIRGVQEAELPLLRRWRYRLSNTERARYVRQMATMLAAGMPLLEVVESMARGGHPVLRERSREIRKRLRAGEQLSAAFEAVMPDFPDYVPRLCELGESTGALAQALGDAAARMERAEALRRDLRSALTYPAFLLVAGLGITILMFAFVVPRFEALIGDNRADLPLISVMVLSSSAVMRENAVFIGLAAFAAMAGLVSLAKSGELRARLLSTLDRLPLIGPFLQRSDLANWARTMGIAIKNGADLLTAFDLAARAVRSPSFRHGLAEARRAIRAGAPLDQAISDALTIDQSYIDLLRTGRQSAALQDMLLFISDILEDDARERARRLTTLAEPVAIVLIAVVVGLLVLGIVLAMTSLYQFEV